jgi:hypothetical protein
MVLPAATFAERARRSGARTYYVGPQRPPNVFAFQEVFLEMAGKGLPALLQAD